MPLNIFPSIYLVYNSCDTQTIGAEGLFLHVGISNLHPEWVLQVTSTSRPIMGKKKIMPRFPINLNSFTASWKNLTTQSWWDPINPLYKRIKVNGSDPSKFQKTSNNEAFFCSSPHINWLSWFFQFPVELYALVYLPT